MKKETKRYMIVEYAGTKERVCYSPQEVEQVLEDIRKYNDRLTSKYACGNISTVKIDGKYHLTIHLYNKLTAKDTITNIDNFTRRFSMKELQAYYANKSVMQEGYTPDINIAYFQSIDTIDEEGRPLEIGIKYVPVFYRGDEQYFDEEFVKKCLYYHAQQCDTDFFKALAYEFNPYHVVADQVDNLYYYADRVEHQGYSPNCLYQEACDLYKRLIADRLSNGRVSRDGSGAQQVSTRRKRDFAFFLRDYNTRKKSSPLKYNGSTTAMKRQDLLELREGLLKRADIQNAHLLVREVSRKKGKKQ